MPNEKTTFTGRSYRDFNADKFAKELKSKPLISILYEPDPSLAWDFYFGYIKKVTDLLYLLRIFTITKKKPSYITNELLELAKDREY